MSIFNSLRLSSISSFLSKPSLVKSSEIYVNEALIPSIVGGVSMLLGGVRGKKSFSGGATRNRGSKPPGKRRGIKVYDGQRIPVGTALIKQYRANILPGWNADFSLGNTIKAKVSGRVMVTTERTDLNFEHDRIRLFPMSEEAKQEAQFRHYIHVIPDKQHQYFKLVDQV